MISRMITGLSKLLPWRDSTIVRTATQYTDTDTDLVTSKVSRYCLLEQYTQMYGGIVGGMDFDETPYTIRVVESARIRNSFWIVGRGEHRKGNQSM